MFKIVNISGRGIEKPTHLGAGCSVVVTSKELGQWKSLINGGLVDVYQIESTRTSEIAPMFHLPSIPYSKG